MDLVVDVASIVFVGLLGGYTGLSIHELTHYLFYRLFGGDPELIFTHHIPTAVDFNHRKLSNIQLRIGGGFTIVYPFGTIIFLIYNGLPRTLIGVFIFLTLVGGSGYSPADLLSLSFPKESRRYQNFRENNELVGIEKHLQALRFFKRGMFRFLRLE